MAFEAEAYETMEAFESESESESSEAVQSIRKPSNKSSYMGRSFGPTPPVSQAQLQATLSRVDNKIKTVADVESTINSKVNSLAAATKKEVADRKKSVETQIKDMNQKLQMLTILPLLITPPTVALPAGNNLLGPGKDLPAVSVPDTSKFNSILPLLLVGGLGGSGGLGLGGDGSSSGGNSGADSSLLVLALALAFTKP